MLLIDDVIKKMQEIRAEHGNIEVCKVGNFGEINEMDGWSITTRKAYINYNNFEQKMVVDIYTPDIGPEPD